MDTRVAVMSVNNDGTGKAIDLQKTIAAVGAAGKANFFEPDGFLEQ